MRFLFDTASLVELRRAAARGIVNGVTASPSPIDRGLARFLNVTVGG